MRLLNVSVSPPKFKYKDLSTLTPLLQSGDFITTINLKDGFHHVSILPAHQHLLAFAWQNQMYAFQVLPFSLAASPWIFTHYVHATVQFLHHQGIQAMAYMDNVIILSQSYTKAHHHTTFTLHLFKKLGWVVNTKKSNTTPSQCKEFLRLMVNTSSTPTFHVPLRKAHNLQHNINHLLQHAKTHRSVPVQRLAAVVSQGMALTRAILPAKLLLHNAYHNIGQRTSWNSSIKLSPATTNNLKEWRHSLSTWNGRIAVLRPHDVILETNASLSGWGASSSCQTLTAAGWWSSDDSKSHINILKLATVRNTILALQPHLQGKAILMRCNNIATVAHLNHMGGQSVAMNRVQKEIHLLCKRLHIQLSSAYLPGLCNSEADRLSRLHPHHEWHLSREAFESINKKWGPHSIDQTATRENRQLPRFNSRFMEADGEATDCLLQDWRNDNNWTAPPIALIPHILNLVERQGVTATIVAPIWPGCRWASHLQRLLINSPV